jgi:hypothetical protein
VLCFHHSAFVVEDIERWEKRNFVEKKVADVVDPVQNARLCLYKHFANDSFLEVIQPLDEKAFTWSALKKRGEHFNHFCYKADSYDEVVKVAEEQKFIHVLGPVQALLFKMEPVVFYYTRNRQIIEFLISPNENKDLY